MKKQLVSVTCPEGFKDRFKEKSVISGKTYPVFDVGKIDFHIKSEKGSELYCLKNQECAHLDSEFKWILNYE